MITREEKHYYSICEGGLPSQYSFPMMDKDVAKTSLQFLLIKGIFKLFAGASSCKEIHEMQVDLIFDIIFIVH